MEQPGAREHVGGFSHEVDAAEDDGFGVGASAGGVGELEGVADEVGVLHDLVALVEVAEDDEAVAQRVLRRADAEIELGGGGVAVLRWKAWLARCVGGDTIRHGCARAVAWGLPVELPGGFGEG